MLSRPVPVPVLVVVPVARQALAVLAMIVAPVLVLVPSIGCGAPKTTDGAAGATPGASAKDGASGVGPTAPATAGPTARPFAGSAAEATQLIGAAVDKKSPEVQKCVIEYRTQIGRAHV